MAKHEFKDLNETVIFDKNEILYMYKEDNTNLNLSMKNAVEFNLIYDTNDARDYDYNMLNISKPERI